MADGVSLSMGGRVASIHRQNLKRRRYTTVVNDIESKRLGFLKKQLEIDRTTEFNRMQKKNERMINANDEMKAFQVALLRRIGVVKEESKMAGKLRPIVNLGRYGGANIDHIKAESEKYKRIRDPQTRRMIKAKIFLEQSKRDGRIKEFDPQVLGNMAEDILKLYKAEVPNASGKAERTPDIGNLDDIIEADGSESTTPPSTIYDDLRNIDKTPTDQRRATYPPSKPRQLVLPPLQVKRTLNPNSNYYRKVSADFHKRQALERSRRLPSSPIHRRLSLLEDITEERTVKERSYGLSNPSKTYSTKFPVASIAHHKPQASKEPGRSKGRNPAISYEWGQEQTIGPLKAGKHFNNNQQFWKPNESFPGKTSRNISLPRIS